jgi:hypothetical protein
VLRAACGSSVKHGSPVKNVLSEVGLRARGLLRASVLVALLGCLGLLVCGCGRSSAPITQEQKVSSYVAYAACLNKHGVQVQVARTGGLVWEAAPGVPGARTPQAAAAEHDCKALVPTGWYQAPTAAEDAENLALMLRLAKCMRAHGVPNFPDPTSSGLRFSPSSRINPQSPAFLAAQKRCQRDSLTIGGGS